jgi:hypothetical protein
LLYSNLIKYAVEFLGCPRRPLASGSTLTVDRT